MAKRFIAVTPNLHLNRDLVEAVALDTTGGREIVVLHMLSGATKKLNSSVTMAEVLRQLEGEEQDFSVKPGAE